MKQLKGEEIKAKELWSILDEIAKKEDWYLWFPEVTKSMVIKYAKAQNLISEDEYRILSKYIV